MISNEVFKHICSSEHKRSHLHRDRVFKVISFNNLFLSVVFNDVSNTVQIKKKNVFNLNKGFLLTPTWNTIFSHTQHTSFPPKSAPLSHQPNWSTFIMQSSWFSVQVWEHPNLSPAPLYRSCDITVHEVEEDWLNSSLIFTLQVLRLSLFF